jgi:hypothetical protein
MTINLIKSEILESDVASLAMVQNKVIFATTNGELLYINLIAKKMHKEYADLPTTHNQKIKNIWTNQRYIFVEFQTSDNILVLNPLTLQKLTKIR